LISTTIFYHKQCGETYILPILILLPSEMPELKFGCSLQDLNSYSHMIKVKLTVGCTTAAVQTATVTKTM